jgi:hypothetical protein
MKTTEPTLMNLLQAFTEDCQEISKTANAIIRRLAAPGGIPTPVFYNQVMGEVATLAQKWERHLRLLSKISLSAETQSLVRIEMNAADMAEELEARSSAGWARTPELGVTSMRRKVADTLITLLQLVEEQRTCVPALLQRAPSKHTPHVPATRELAIA